ncbi:MAG: tRNA threonylcarbamoyladenosine dehydratase [Clostridia bacterium]|nr:tRNA threonylcarbamoyladenosine dehydratase [Clostridia bacterium]
MEGIYQRSEMLFGKENIEKLKQSHVAVFGIGGVGSYVCEALARAGVGELDLIDKDTVSLSNINRQLVALHSTVGKNKAEVMKQRIADINPEIKVNAFDCFFLPENSSEFDFKKYDYVVDAVDNITAKLELVRCCNETGTPIISSMGTGNKINPQLFEVADIKKTSVCPLAKVMRKKLKEMGINSLNVVYSKETPIKRGENGRTPASSSFTPPVAGMLLAGEVIKDLLGFYND